MLADKDAWHATKELRLVRARYGDTLQAVEWLAGYLSNEGYNRQALQVRWYGEGMAKYAEAHLNAIAEKDSVAPDNSARPPGADTSSGANGHGTPAGLLSGAADEKGTPIEAPGLMMAGPELEPVTDLILELIDKRLDNLIAHRADVVAKSDEQTWEVAVKFLREAKAFAVTYTQQRRFALSKWRAVDNVLKGVNSE